MQPGRYKDVAGQVRERTRTGTDVRPGKYEDTSGQIHVRTAQLHLYLQCSFINLSTTGSPNSFALLKASHASAFLP